MARFSLDWKSKGVIATATTETTVETTDETKWVKVWVTNSQLARPAYLNSQDDADTSCANAATKRRLHSTDRGLAEAGVLEYEHWVLKESFGRQKREAHSLTQ